MSSKIKLTQRGLERRLKRHLLKTKHSFLATCVPGLELYLRNEIELLPNVENITQVTGGIEFDGDFNLIYHSNLKLRCANKILLRITSFNVRSYPELFNKIKRISWELYLGFSSNISINVTAKHSRIHHTKRISESVYTSIYKSVAPLGLAPKFLEESPIKIQIRIFDDKCTVSMNTSGELLYFRGYKQAVAKAPVRESIASALLYACNIKQYPVIADPFCGSGTFLTESAYILKSYNPGRLRTFAFESWPSFNKHKWDNIKKQNTDCSILQFPKIYGSDNNPVAISSAKDNAERAGVLSDIKFSVQDFNMFNNQEKIGSSGLIVSNLPYGKRIGEIDNIKQLYSKLGLHLRTFCKGWHFGFLIADRKMFNATKLKYEKSLYFKNGGIKVEFVMGVI